MLSVSSLRGQPSCCGTPRVLLCWPRFNSFRNPRTACSVSFLGIVAEVNVVLDAPRRHGACQQPGANPRHSDGRMACFRGGMMRRRRGH
jgi:hypothetical protein